MPKVPSNQLNLFHEVEIEEVNEKLSKAANDILAALNEGMKDKYEPHYYYQEKDLVILMAVNKHKESVFNVLDLEGKTPNGFSACWRGLGHIKINISNYLEGK